MYEMKTDQMGTRTGTPTCSQSLLGQASWTQREGGR